MLFNFIGTKLNDIHISTKKVVHTQYPNLISFYNLYTETSNYIIIRLEDVILLYVTEDKRKLYLELNNSTTNEVRQFQQFIKSKFLRQNPELWCQKFHFPEENNIIQVHSKHIDTDLKIEKRCNVYLKVKSIWSTGKEYGIVFYLNDIFIKNHA